MDYDKYYKDKFDINLTREFTYIYDHMTSSQSILNEVLKVIVQQYGHYPYSEGTVSYLEKLEMIKKIFTSSNSTNGLFYLFQETFNLLKFVEKHKILKNDGLGRIYETNINQINLNHSLALQKKIIHILNNLNHDIRQENEGKYIIYKKDIATEEVINIVTEVATKWRLLEFNSIDVNEERQKHILNEFYTYFEGERRKIIKQYDPKLEKYLFRIANSLRHKHKETDVIPFVDSNKSYWIRKCYNLFLQAFLLIENINTYNEFDINISDK